MQASRLSVAVLTLAAVAAPVGIALAAEPDAPPPARAVGLDAQLAGQRSFGGQMRRAAAVLRRRTVKRTRVAVPIPPLLARIAECESHGNPRAIGGGGAYRGAFQFSQDTWNSVGGHGDPAKAPMAEQVRRAEILLARSGPGQWPVCSQ